MSIEITTRGRRHEDAEADGRAAMNASHPRFSHPTLAWTAAGTAILGAGTALYGANRQSKDQAKANAENKLAVEQADLRAWQNYLMQRGLNPQGVTQFGQIPTNAAAVNTRLPLWATVQQTTPVGPPTTAKRKFF